jgi:cyclopropane fatty-acyl-phospholipid synthase-like methyltransferase
MKSEVIERWSRGRTKWTGSQVANYYAEMTDVYLGYGGQPMGWHFALWDDSTHTHDDAILRSNRILAEGWGLEPGQLVLDAGCGVGGLSLYLAETFGSGLLVSPSVSPTSS